MDQLMTSLLDLLRELEGRDISITVAGGFGLYLKRQRLDADGAQTLFNQLPHPRSTNDLDLFLQTKVLVDLKRTRQVAEAIDRLGYTAVDEAKYLQWEREINVGGVPQKVKIDLLVGPLGDAQRELKVKMPRVRPKGDIQFHAHAVEEAITIEEEVNAATVIGQCSTGKSYEASVLIPQAFPYLLMKLHAFDDRRRKADEADDQITKEKERDKERQHAIDLYTIVAMMTEEEYDRTKELGAVHAANEHVVRACAIVRQHFATNTAAGILRLREHLLYRNDFPLEQFMEVLKEVLNCP